MQSDEKSSFFAYLITKLLDSLNTLKATKEISNIVCYIALENNEEYL